MKIKVKDIMAGLIMGVILSHIACVSYAFYSRYEIRKQLNETEFDLRKNNVDLSIITENEEKKADIDDLSLYEILEKAGEIKYELKVDDKTYELQSITDKVVNDYIISIDDITDFRRKELSDIMDKLDSRWRYPMVFSMLLGVITGTLMSARKSL